LGAVDTLQTGTLRHVAWKSALDGQLLWAIEVKRSLSPRLGRGCHQARADLQPEQTFVVIPGDGGYGVEVLGLAQLAERIHGQR